MFKLMLRVLLFLVWIKGSWALSIEDVIVAGNLKLVVNNRETTRLLRVNEEGRVSWYTGFPTVYNVFREQVVKSNETEVRSYTLEAVATRRWLCMKPNGRIYTVRQPSYNRTFKVRHELSKRRRKKRLLQFIEQPQRPPPPINCLFRTFTFSAEASYERSIAIYSASHGNATHSRFLATSPRDETRVRTYRRSFDTLSNIWFVRTGQYPVNELRSVVEKSRFGGGRNSTARVKTCMEKMLNCEVDIPWRRRHGRGNLIHRLLKGCKRKPRSAKCPTGVQFPFQKKRTKTKE